MADNPTGTAKADGAPKPNRDLIKRGVYASNPLGTTTFVGLRALDPILQYQLLARGWGESFLSRIGISSIPLHGHGISDYLSYSSLPKDSAGYLTALDAVSLRDLPVSRLILLGMATGSTLKQIFWLLYLSREELTPASAVAVSGYNTVVNSLASLLLLSSTASSALASPKVSIPGGSGLALSLPTAVGVVLYTVGMALETVSEMQRKRFKDKSENKGKICATGLWASARHINYGGYTLWRTGYGLAAGGWVAGAAVAAWHWWTFVKSSVPILNDYMVKKYPAQWKKYQRDVKWMLIPGVF
ncbi:hypothetical protein OQA88_7144 [Cercophora sp. LCS_1]